MSAIEDIAAERRRQIEVEGWTVEHDDAHYEGDLARAAAAYAVAGNPPVYITLVPPRSVSFNAGRFEAWRALWPWGEGWWKPTDRRRDLVKAGALIVAEIERLDRLAAKEPKT